MADPVLSFSEWRVLLKGRRASMESDECTLLLRRYHGMDGTDVDARFNVLDRIDTICQAYLKGFGIHWRTAPLLAPMLTLGMVAERHKNNIRTAKKSWQTLRQGFGASRGALGPTRLLIHRTAAAAAPSTDGNYWLERADPKHRSWGHHGAALFDRWYASGETISFWKWLEKTGNDTDAGVQYLSPDQRWKYWVVFGEDRHLWRHHETTKEFERFSTQHMSTAFSGMGAAIWVCSPQGVIYSASHAVSAFHHSSFLSGKPVLGAGEWIVSNGTILVITHKTGHYRATPADLLRVLQHLEHRTNISRTIVEVANYVTRSMSYYNAREFLTNAGNTAACTAITAINPMVQAVLRANAGVDWDANANAVNVALRPARVV